MFIKTIITKNRLSDLLKTNTRHFYHRSKITQLSNQKSTPGREVVFTILSVPRLVETNIYLRIYLQIKRFSFPIIYQSLHLSLRRQRPRSRATGVRLPNRSSQLKMSNIFRKRIFNFSSIKYFNFAKDFNLCCHSFFENLTFLDF